jgi:hypothetical protein
MRLHRAAGVLVLASALVVGPQGARAVGTTDPRISSPGSSIPIDHPRVIPTSGGAVLALPNGLHAALANRHPTLRADNGSIFSSLSMFGRLRRRGVDYGFAVQVFRDEDPRFGTFTDISLSFGTGRGRLAPKYRIAAQDHLYSSSISDRSFQLRDDLSRAHVGLGGQLGAWGSVDVRFHGTDTVTTRCGGRSRTRSGRARGSVVFTPRHDNGFFGTIARARFDHAELSVSTCLHRGLGGGGGTPCPPPYALAEGDSFQERRYRNFFASTDEFVPGMVIESAVAQEFWPRMSVTHDIFAIVPRSWVRDSEGGFAWHGSERAFLPGAVVVHGEGPPEVDGPYPCDGGTVSYELTDGTLTGVRGHPMTALFDTGVVTAPLAPQAWDASIERIEVTS